ncbi:MAG: hypothetical protein WCL30_04540 [Pseudomonadota bacterium]
MNSSKCSHPRKNVFPKEILTRFEYDPIYIKNGIVNQNVYKSGKDGTLSVYRTNEISVQRIWDICDKYVDGKRLDGKKAIGRVEILAEVFLTSGLNFDPNGKPHTRHINVIGWHSDKPQDLTRRQELAKLATGFIRPK